jgi:hypothetical protein
MTGTNDFVTYMSSLESPAEHGFAVTPHDTNELPHYTRAIYVGGAGNIVLTTVGGDTITLTGVLAGMVYPVRAKIIKNSSTTATNMVGLY